MKKQAPQYKTLCLLDLDYYFPHWLLYIKPKKIIKTIKKHGLDGVNVWAGKIINPSFVKAFHNENLYFYVWTINDLNKAQKVLSFGVDAIATDRAEWLTKHLTENNS